jgi:hypothetical protein
VTGSACSDLALHFLNRYNVFVIKILSKFELRRLCRVVGATVMTRLGAPTAEEIGYCDVVESLEIGGDRCTVFRQEQVRSFVAKEPRFYDLDLLLLSTVSKWLIFNRNLPRLPLLLSVVLL